MEHATVWPSPMLQTTRVTRPVAVTEYPPAEAVLVLGPHVLASGEAAHSQIGRPTSPTEPGKAFIRWGNGPGGTTMLDGRLLQIGGDATTGRGLVLSKVEA